MADWRNRMGQITNKIKFQLNAKGIDNMVQLRDTVMVSASGPLGQTCDFSDSNCLEIREGQQAADPP